MSADEKYVRVTAKLKARSFKAILLVVEESDGWVARSCISYSSDRKADHMQIGDEGEFEIMEWVAKQRGFI